MLGVLLVGFRQLPDGFTAFADPDRTIEIDDRRDYREERFRLTGNIKGRLYVVVFTPRHDVIRIISAHKANQREIKRYEDSAHED